MGAATVDTIFHTHGRSAQPLSREKGAQTSGPLSIVGGVASDPVFAQTLADALNRDIRVCSARHAGMLGTATLAAPLMGWANSVCDAAAILKTRTSASYAPNPKRTAQLTAQTISNGVRWLGQSAAPAIAALTMPGATFGMKK